MAKKVLPKASNTANEKDRRKKARKRRENAAVRQREQDARDYGEIPPPLAIFEILPKVLQTGNSNMVMAIVKEMPPKKDFAGRYKQRDVVQHLNIALGVQTLLAYHCLAAVLGSGAKAKEELGKLGGGSDTVDYRLNVGREHLTSRTAFESEAELKLWAPLKLQMDHGAAPYAAELTNKILAETEAVRLISRAYDRAQRVSAAHKVAVDMGATDAAAQLELAYNHPSTDVSSVEACQIAISADINPAELWMKYGASFGKTFEIARFIGRINAGVEARLGPELFGIARQVLAAQPCETQLSRAWTRLREFLILAISADQFDQGLRSAEAVAGIIRIARTTRELSVERPSTAVP
ncbi:MAG: hypothetical protein E6614_00055 [Bradyrhizobium sp.]|uniref:Uncharacterized protein n=1 Tax=Bradyrhizobium denitrificans TaxID=2734912 RepID=A0ABS5GJ76_9BRAD|nr:MULTISPECIES: hypothetical protein [Bradyrhizobium]MDU2920761.1 hypothetical protein [Klebsiella quasipneumoniae]MBR1141373.1 hypothetical protein [Bradyrhizobium denitrificans]MDU0953599.1 hypothetical protein [Bradyrhizobium sp.]MDU1497243.1 hypothetical protein [Bradyrhizobium sp.]MDU1547307.1 hypothetical protein [Bradyrhizobium sp.]